MEEAYDEKKIKAKLAELAEQRGLLYQNEWPVFMWVKRKKEGKEIWESIEVARIDHAWYINIELHNKTWPLPIIVFEIAAVRKIWSLPEMKKDLENIRLSGAALGVIVLQTSSEEELQQEIPKELFINRLNIMRVIAHPIRIGIAYAGDILRGKLRIEWLSDLY